MHKEVSCVIPGASRPEQLISNLSSDDLPDLTEYEMYGVDEVYHEDVKSLVHHLW